jgi:pyrimidine-nucleoside phosphorylase
MIGEAAVMLGAGRSKKGDPVDHAVGLIIHHKVGGKVEKGEPLYTIHANDLTKLNQVHKFLNSAFSWSDTPVAPLPHYYD